MLESCLTHITLLVPACLSGQELAATFSFLETHAVGHLHAHGLPWLSPPRSEEEQQFSSKMHKYLLWSHFLQLSLITRLYFSYTSLLAATTRAVLLGVFFVAICRHLKKTGETSCHQLLGMGFYILQTCSNMTNVSSDAMVIDTAVELWLQWAKW